MKKIAFVIPYFGKFPNYFELWVKSVESNPTIDFILYTDNNIDFCKPTNLKIIKTNFIEFKNKIQKVIEFPISLKTPYKLCDYKPVYGKALESDLKGYDFWGYCDMDLIFGNIRKFVTEEILNGYDKIFTHGHMTIFRNNDKCKELFRCKHNFMAYRYDEAYKTEYCCHFDEWGGISTYLDELNFLQYDANVYADVDCKKYAFKMFGRNDISYPMIFEWNEGKAFCHTNLFGQVELLYIHLQKRKMSVNIDISKSLRYLIIPNKFVEYTNVTEEYIVNNAKNSIYFEYWIIRLKELWVKFKTGAIKQIFLRRYKKWRIKHENK